MRGEARVRVRVRIEGEGLNVVRVTVGRGLNVRKIYSYYFVP